MSFYTITEPHPTVPKDTYTHSGRGGAGNTFRAPQTTSPSGVPTPSLSSAHAPSMSASMTTKTRFYSGRGGAGNAHAVGERPVLSFDEEYASAAAREKVHYGHVGRGGAGNVFSDAAGGKTKSSRRKSSDAASCRSAGSSSADSVRSGFWGRLSGASLGAHN